MINDEQYAKKMKIWFRRLYELETINKTSRDEMRKIKNEIKSLNRNVFVAEDLQVNKNGRTKR